MHYLLVWELLQQLLADGYCTSRVTRQHVTRSTEALDALHAGIKCCHLRLSVCHTALGQMFGSLLQGL
jgi:hypothetical protein